MARVKISEFRAKTIVYKAYGKEYGGLELLKNDEIEQKIKKSSSDKTYVVKVDEGVKKRGKSGLLFTKIKKQDVPEKASVLFKKGYTKLLVEEYISHEDDEEKYLSLERVRDGIKAVYSASGGINVEDSKGEIKESVIGNGKSDEIDSYFGIENFSQTLVSLFNNQYFSFLETNPFLVKDKKPVFLDLAVEVDDTATLLNPGDWSEEDFVEANTLLTPEELAVKKLAESSSASLKLKVLNPNGSIFTIFSGGGASIVLADEIGNIGKSSELVNYAEYSGNPNEEETYLFTKNILSLVKKSPAKNKLLYIAGGVANFTDVRATFKGVIRALNEDGAELKKQGLKVYVRRGGPHQEEGLKMIKHALELEGLSGRVSGPEEVLTDIITKK